MLEFSVRLPSDPVPGYLADFSTETVGLSHRSDGPPTFNILSPILDCLINEMTWCFFSSSESIFIGISALDLKVELFLSEQDLLGMLGMAKIYSIDKQDLEYENPLVKS